MTVMDITFTRNRQVKRNGIRVGWIEDHDDIAPNRWKLRFTPASGMPGVHGCFVLLRDAKAAAVRALENKI